MNYVTFLPARGVGTAVPEPSWKASAGLEAHAANMLAAVPAASRARFVPRPDRTDDIPGRESRWQFTISYLPGVAS